MAAAGWRARGAGTAARVHAPSSAPPPPCQLPLRGLLEDCPQRLDDGHRLIDLLFRHPGIPHGGHKVASHQVEVRLAQALGKEAGVGLQVANSSKGAARELRSSACISQGRDLLCDTLTWRAPPAPTPSPTEGVPSCHPPF